MSRQRYALEVPADGALERYGKADNEIEFWRKAETRKPEKDRRGALKDADV